MVLNDRLKIGCSRCVIYIWFFSGLDLCFGIFVGLLCRLLSLTTVLYQIVCMAPFDLCSLDLSFGGVWSYDLTPFCIWL